MKNSPPDPSYEWLLDNYQKMVAKYYAAQVAFEQAQADFERLQASYQQAQKETTRLLTVVEAKQEVIEKMLPYYPEQAKAALQAKINLAA